VLSTIVLGTAGFGSAISVDDSFAVLDAYLAAGGNFIDTAHIYADWIPGGAGASERTIGAWLAARGLRDSIFLATKGGHPPLDALDQGRCSRADLEQDLSESLERLGVKHIDLYWLHRDDPALPVEQIVDTLVEFLASGLIDAYGFSNWPLARIQAAIGHAQAAGYTAPWGSQIGWALVDRRDPNPPVAGMSYMTPAQYRWHCETAFPVAAYTAQARGYFGEANVAWARNGFMGPAPLGPEYDSSSSRRRLLQSIKLAEQKSCAPNQIALAWLLGQPFPVRPIVGTGSVAHLCEAMGATAIALTANERLSLHLP